MEYIPDQFEYLRALALPLLHAVLHGGDDVVGLVLRAVFGGLFRRPWGALEVFLMVYRDVGSVFNGK